MCVTFLSWVVQLGWMQHLISLNAHFHVCLSYSQLLSLGLFPDPTTYLKHELCSLLRTPPLPFDILGQCVSLSSGLSRMYVTLVTRRHREH